MATTPTAITQIIESARAIRKTGDASIDRAHDQFLAGTITAADFNTAFLLSLRAAQSAIDLNNAATHMLVQELEKSAGKIFEASKKLDAVTKRIEKAASAIGIVAKL